MSESLKIEKDDQKGLSIHVFRDMIVEAEKRMVAAGGLDGPAMDERYPLKHSFGKGLYVREFFAPAGTLIISKIHKHDHPYFIMKGCTSVLTEEGVDVLEAPFYGITKSGTKRALYVHEDLTWITVHATDKDDLAEIEEEIIAKDFEDLGGI